MTDEQRKAAVAMFGEEFANQLIAQGEQKTKELEEAGVASKAATPEGQPAETPEITTPPAEGQQGTAPATPTGELAQKAIQTADPNQLLQALAVEMMKGLNETLTPILTEIKQSQVALSDRVSALETEQAAKQKIEMPRFVFSQLMASQSPQTSVPEGDALKNQKPKEAPAIATDGSVAAAYFPARK